MDQVWHRMHAHSSGRVLQALSKGLKSIEVEFTALASDVDIISQRKRDEKTSILPQTLANGIAGIPFINHAMQRQAAHLERAAKLEAKHFEFKWVDMLGCFIAWGHTPCQNQIAKIHQITQT